MTQSDKCLKIHSGYALEKRFTVWDTKQFKAPAVTTWKMVLVEVERSWQIRDSTLKPHDKAGTMQY
jgi:hypothetical protein